MGPKTVVMNITATDNLPNSRIHMTFIETRWFQGTIRPWNTHVPLGIKLIYMSHPGLAGICTKGDITTRSRPPSAPDFFCGFEILNTYVLVATPRWNIWSSIIFNGTYVFGAPKSRIVMNRKNPRAWWAVGSLDRFDWLHCRLWLSHLQ